jgi:hypothetical protein
LTALLTPELKALRSPFHAALATLGRIKIRLEIAPRIRPPRLDASPVTMLMALLVALRALFHAEVKIPPMMPGRALSQPRTLPGSHEKHERLSGPGAERGRLGERCSLDGQRHEQQAGQRGGNSGSCSAESGPRRGRVSHRGLTSDRQRF